MSACLHVYLVLVSLSIKWLMKSLAAKRQENKLQRQETQDQNQLVLQRVGPEVFPGSPMKGVAFRSLFTQDVKQKAWRNGSHCCEWLQETPKDFE